MNAADEHISADVYPDVHESRGMKKNAERIEKSIDEYIQKNKNNNYAMAKALFYCNKESYYKFFFIRVVSKVIQTALTMTQLEIMADLERHKDGYSYDQMFYPLMVALLWLCGALFDYSMYKYFDIEMVQTGQITCSALKTILLKKSFRMSEASNKDFSSGEINSIIMNETRSVWSFVWDMATYIEVPLDMMLGLYLGFSTLGWPALIIIFFHASLIYYRK